VALAGGGRPVQMCSPARRSILLYIPYVVKFGQTARAHYANIQEVRNSGAGVSAFWRDAVRRCPVRADESLSWLCSTVVYPLCVYYYNNRRVPPLLFDGGPVVPGGATATTTCSTMRTARCQRSRGSSLKITCRQLAVAIIGLTRTTPLPPPPIVRRVPRFIPSAPRPPSTARQNPRRIAH